MREMGLEEEAKNIIEGTCEQMGSFNENWTTKTFAIRISNRQQEFVVHIRKFWHSQDPLKVERNSE